MAGLFTTQGRIPRSTFWKFYAVLYVMGIVVGAIEAGHFPDGVKGIVGLLYLPVLIVAIMAQIRRWHDRDKSGWWFFINFIPCIGGIWSLIECGFLKGTDGPNRFGSDPLQQ